MSNDPGAAAPSSIARSVPRHVYSRALLAGTTALLLLAAAFFASGGLAAQDDSSLSISVDPAPITGDGTVAGAVTDIVLTLVDIDPAVPGIPIAIGGTVTVELPAGFVNLGEIVVGQNGTDACGACSTVILLQGWPQSPVPPFPTVAWDADTNTVTITSTIDWGAVEGPGVKQVHLLLRGFQNPRAGEYAVDVTVQPDPDVAETLQGTATVRILDSVQPSLSAISTINPGPPPPFPNSRYQTLAAGDTPLLWGFYLWDETATGIVGADLARDSATDYRLVDAAGATIGEVQISAPDGATDFGIESIEPAVAVNAVVSGAPTALLTVQFTPDATVAGDYVVTLQLRDARGPTPLAAGLNEIIYQGPTRPVAEALLSIAGDYSVIWHWDNATQVWSSSRPGFEFLADLDEVVAGDVYWIVADAATDFYTGSSMSMFVTVTN